MYLRIRNVSLLDILSYPRRKLLDMTKLLDIFSYCRVDIIFEFLIDTYGIVMIPKYVGWRLWT